MRNSKQTKAPVQGFLLEEAIRTGLDAFEAAIYRLVCTVVKPRKRQQR